MQTLYNINNFINSDYFSMEAHSKQIDTDFIEETEGKEFL